MRPGLEASSSKSVSPALQKRQIKQGQRQEVGVIRDKQKTKRESTRPPRVPWWSKAIRDPQGTQKLTFQAADCQRQLVKQINRLPPHQLQATQRHRPP